MAEVQVFLVQNRRYKRTREGIKTLRACRPQQKHEIDTLL